MADSWTLLSAGIETLGVPVDARFEGRTRRYLAELQRWNRVSRLTGYGTPAELILHVVLDSLMWLLVLPSPAAPLLDIGSGAGVPGLVLKLARPEWAVTLVEAARRRANFLRHTIRLLGLEGVTVAEARAESLAALPGQQGAYQSVTMRAVAGLDLALDLARPFLAAEGQLVVSLGPEGAPAGLATREVELVSVPVGLRLRRRFLIIRANEWPSSVPRGTREAVGPRPQRRQPEGRGREDHDGGQPRRRAGDG